jgi:hypothetical protein
MNVQDFLALLKGVKQVGPDRWTALCPGHDDRSPSLSIREAGDGKILLTCWSCCTAEEIVAALGLTMADLFPDNSRHIRGEKRPRPSRKEKELRELAARFDRACVNAHRRLAVLFRAIGWIFATYGLDVTLDEARWIWELPHMEHVLDQLLLGDPEEKFAGLQAAGRWLA